MGLDSVELVIAIECAFGVRIPDSTAEQLITPRADIDWLMTKQAAGELFVEPGAALEKRLRTRDETAREVRTIIVEQTGIEKFSDDDHFIRDLRIDS